MRTPRRNRPLKEDRKPAPYEEVWVAKTRKSQAGIEYLSYEPEIRKKK